MTPFTFFNAPAPSESIQCDPIIALLAAHLREWSLLSPTLEKIIALHKMAEKQLCSFPSSARNSLTS